VTAYSVSEQNFPHYYIAFANPPLMPYYIGDKLHEKAPHHESIKALWELKWKRPVELHPLERSERDLLKLPQCTFGVYPFMDSKLEDFERVFAKLIEVS